MPPSKKLPSTPEIKSAINAARMAGMIIGTIEIEPGKIRIVAAEPFEDGPQLSAYDRWKARQTDSEVG